MEQQKPNWTEESIASFRYRITSDFIDQIQLKMKADGITQRKLAKKLNLTAGRISQILNDPGNITLNLIIRLARAVELKVAIVLYDDGDPKNYKGLIHSEIFRICWERAGKPRNMWDIQKLEKGLILSPSPDHTEAPGRK